MCLSVSVDAALEIYRYTIELWPRQMGPCYKSHSGEILRTYMYGTLLLVVQIFAFTVVSHQANITMMMMIMIIVILETLHKILDSTTEFNSNQ